jgi:hypothetical protein
MTRNKGILENRYRGERGKTVFCSNIAPLVAHVAALLTMETIYVFAGMCVVSLTSVKKQVNYTEYLFYDIASISP